MFKKLLSSLLAVLLLLSCCTVAMAAGDTPDFQIKTLETTIDSITVGIYTCEDAALKNSRIVFTYPEALTLVSAEATLPEEESPIWIHPRPGPFPLPGPAWGPREKPSCWCSNSVERAGIPILWSSACLSREMPRV